MTVDLRYPIGSYRRPTSLSPAERTAAIARLVAQPAALRAAVTGLNDAQLDTPYRPEGWSVRQLAHHVADSHLNMYIRIKLALTETEPTIKPYDQDAWVTLADVRTVSVMTSMTLFEAVHERAVAVLNAMSADDFTRTLYHPENGVMNIDQVLAMYAWHGDHHTAHIVGLRARMGW
jgi:hypothetical protein